jgi:hypothetical protein
MQTPVAGTNKIVMHRIQVADMMCPTTQMAPLFGEGTGDEQLVIEEVVPAVTGEHRALAPRDSFVGLEPVDLRMSGLVPIEDRVSEPVDGPVAPVASVELADDLAAVASTSVPVKAVTADSTAPLSLSQVERDSMTAIARVNDAVMSGALEPPQVPVEIEGAADSTLKHRDGQTSLGVAPLEPATTVRSPFVIDTPVERWSPLPRSKPVTAPLADATAAGSNRLPTTSSGEETPLSRHERTAMLALDPSSGMPRSGPWQALAAVARTLRSVRWWRRRKTTRVKPIVP